MTAIWKINRTPVSSSSPAPGPVRPLSSIPAAKPPARAVPFSPSQSTIGKGIVFSGEISGSEPLYIEGKVEGIINLPGSRVTVGRGSQVTASIMASEIVVQGAVLGNVSAFDRIEICSEGSLVGDVIAARISIEDGAFLKGVVDFRKPDHKSESKPESVVSAPLKASKPVPSAPAPVRASRPSLPASAPFNAPELVLQ